MTFRTILVQVEPEPSRLAAVRAAVAVAGLFDAVVIGVGSAALDPFLDPAVPYMKPPLRQALAEEIKQNLRRAEAQFRDVAGADAARALWRAIPDHPLGAMLRAAPAADLIVASHPGPADPKACADVGALIMAAGLPVLLAPAQGDEIKASRIVVGWKNTREGRRAVTDSLPFLKRAERVVVVAGDEDGLDVDRAAELEDVALRLSRHGVKAAIELRPSRDHPADMLVALAEQEDADLIVVGAYGHARLRELVFGGVTQSLLSRCPVFVLFSR